MLTAEKFAVQEICPRRREWTDKYQNFRVSIMGAVYRALDAGLRAESDPERAAENQMIALASNPGLDLEGPEVYPIAMHHARLAGIISVCLRSGGKAPWRPWGDVDGSFPWRSACYDAGDGQPRRVVLVDRWSDDRKMQETHGWRTVGELVALNRPIVLTSVEIGSSRAGRRVSPWTRCYLHPRNRMYRFRRQSAAEDFGANWKPVWREDSSIKTDEWLDRMTEEGCMDQVKSCVVPVPTRPAAYLREMERLASEMRVVGEPPMRLAGCYDRMSGPCVFACVCHGKKQPQPELYGFKLRAS
jgi:hypothetical protein